MDESGNQLAVFGRRGARPFNLAEMQRMYLLDGNLFTVTDNPSTPANEFKVTAASSGGDHAAPPEAKPAKSGSNNSITPSGVVSTLRGVTTSQTVIGGGMGLLLLGVGWRRLRRRRRAV